MNENKPLARSPSLIQPEMEIEDKVTSSIQNAQLMKQPVAENIFEALCGVAYITDFGGTIMAVASGWRDFAQDNGAAHLSDEAVTGRSIFEFIDGEEVTASYRKLHDALVADQRRKFVFAFRCDAPDTRREMLMSISSVHPRGRQPVILYQSQMISAESRPPIALFEPRRHQGDKPYKALQSLIVLCSYCQRVALPGELGTTATEWIPPEDYYANGGTPDARVSHGVCPTCYDTLMEEIG